MTLSAACGGSHRVSSYASLADADKDGAITRGWIPEFLPASSRNIHETHENSGDVEWCAFECSPRDSQELQKALKSVDSIPVSVQHIPNPRVAWWPAVLTGHVDVNRVRSARLQLYIVEMPVNSVTSEIRLFAVDWTKGTGFFYGTPKP